MRKVIREQPKASINIAETSDAKYYGVLISGDKGFITAKSYGGPKIILCPQSLTRGNGWDGYDAPNLKGTLEALLRDEKDVYEFNTAKELFKWLSE